MGDDMKPKNYSSFKGNIANDLEWRIWVTYKLGQLDTTMRIVFIIITVLVCINVWGVIAS